MGQTSHHNQNSTQLKNVCQHKYLGRLRGLKSDSSPISKLIGEGSTKIVCLHSLIISKSDKSIFLPISLSNLTFKDLNGVTLCI